MIQTVKSGSKPRYIIGDAFDDDKSSCSLNEVFMYLDLGYKCNDIFVLAPSVKSTNTPVRTLANSLASQGFPVFVPNSDDEKLDQDVMLGKIAFISYHQAKGLERAVVLVFCFDSSYFKYYNRNANPYSCTNELYVATTRSRDHLTLIHHNNENFLGFVHENKISETCHTSGQLSITVQSI